MKFIWFCQYIVKLQEYVLLSSWWNWSYCLIHQDDRVLMQWDLYGLFRSIKIGILCLHPEYFEPQYWRLILISQLLSFCRLRPREGAKSLQLCLTLQPCIPVPSVHGILQARILEWVATRSTRRSSQPRDRTCVSCDSCTGRQILYH